MQVLREALLQSLPAQIMQFTVIRNKILCLTQNQLILLCIDAICKKTQIPYNGSCVYKMQMSKDYIALLQRTGRLEIRRVDNLGQIILMDRNIKIVNNQYPRLKWWQDDLHLVYQKYFVTVNVLAGNNNNKVDKQKKQQQKHTVQIKKDKQLLQVQFTDLFIQAKSLFYVFKQQIVLTVNQINIASIEFEAGQEIKQLIRLCHPFQQNQYNKQYLVVLVERTTEKTSIMNNNQFSSSSMALKSKSNSPTKKPSVMKQKSITLKVYNILTLSKIFQKTLLTTTQPQPIDIQILTDELSQYLLIKHYKKLPISKTTPQTNKQIQTQTLLKVNSQYYYLQQKSYEEHYQPFFMFQIEIGLKKDLKLFPSHREQIGGKMCDSIDTCYFENNQVHIASIVLETGYKNDIYNKWRNINIVVKDQFIELNDTEEGQSNQLMIWRQLVEAKVNPNKFIQKLINTSQLNKYNNQQKKYHTNTNNNSLSQQKPSNKTNIIGVQHENILNSLLSKLHKINNFNLLNQKIDAYQTMKKILAIEYFPMLLDVMAIQRDEKKKERQILQKSNQDVTKTMSGCSSSGPQSPRSDHSGIIIVGNQKNRKDIIQNKKTILKDISLADDKVNPETFFINNNNNDENDNHCHDCLQIQDHQNLQLTLNIMNHSSKNSDNALQQIQQSIYKMQTLTKYRLEKIQMKTRKQKKQSNNIVSFIENQFHQSLKNLHQTLLDSAKKFTQRISLMPQQSIAKIKQKQEEFIEIIEQKRMFYDNSAKIHKDNHEQILDHLYDIQFPQIGFQNQPKTDNMFDFFNISDLSKSLLSNSYGLDKTVNQMNLSKQKNEEQFRLFSEFVLKNFI